MPQHLPVALFPTLVIVRMVVTPAEQTLIVNVPVVTLPINNTVLATTCIAAMQAHRLVALLRTWVTVSMAVMCIVVALTVSVQVG